MYKQMKTLYIVQVPRVYIVEHVVTADSPSEAREAAHMALRDDKLMGQLKFSHEVEDGADWQSWQVIELGQGGKRIVVDNQKEKH